MLKLQAELYTFVSFVIDLAGGSFNTTPTHIDNVKTQEHTPERV